VQRAMFSCVVDNKPLYCFQALVFARSLTALAGVEPESVIVHYVEGTAPAMVDLIRELGVRTVACKPFDRRHPPSNKLAQLRSEVLRECEYAVLCDCDIALAGDVSPWIAGDRLRAKPVDYPLPPLAEWRSILDLPARADDPPAVAATHKSGLTYANNFNGGFYIVPQAVLEGLRRTWPAADLKLLDQPGLPPDQARHVDQIALGIALAELDMIGDPLPLALNYPTHLPPSAALRLEEPPRVVHYHKRIALAGRLLRTGDPMVDRAIDLVNDAIADCRPVRQIASTWGFKHAVVHQRMRRAVARARRR
jgi:hypothetical protein